MVEHGIGDAMLALEKVKRKYSPFLAWTEMGDLRAGKKEEKIVLKRGKKVNLEQRRGEVRPLVEDQQVLIEHFKRGNKDFCELGEDLSYELSVMASLLQEVQSGDLKIGQQDLSNDARRALLEMKGKVRKVSDMWGSLANHI